MNNQYYFTIKLNTNVKITHTIAQFNTQERFYCCYIVQYDHVAYGV